MATKIKIGRKDKHLGEEVFFKLLDDFISDSYSGRRLKKNGTKISDGTIKNYIHFKKTLQQFSAYSTFEIKLFITDKLTQTEKERANWNCHLC